jgi:plastocyanin
MRTLIALATLAAALPELVIPASRPRATDVTVAIKTFQFAPDTLRVKAGTRVVWTNADDIEHTITSGTPDSRDGRFNGVLDKRGASYSAVLKETGTYRYFCDRHRFMNGTVIVNH